MLLCFDYCATINYYCSRPNSYLYVFLHSHYDDYSWDELIEFDLNGPFETLGWSRTSWESDDSDTYPVSDNLTWEDLNDEEQEAADEICYFFELWNGVPLPEWEDNAQFLTDAPTPELTVEPTRTPTRSPTLEPILTNAPILESTFESTRSPTSSPGPPTIRLTLAPTMPTMPTPPTASSNDPVDTPVPTHTTATVPPTASITTTSDSNNSLSPQDDDNDRTKIRIIASTIAVLAIGVVILGILVWKTRRPKPTDPYEQSQGDDVSTLGPPSVLGGDSYTGGDHTASLLTSRSPTSTRPSAATHTEPKDPIVFANFDVHKHAPQPDMFTVASDFDEAQYLSTEDSRFSVHVPPGPIGLVIDSQGTRELYVRAMKADSVLQETVHIGDRLEEVDDTNVTSMEAEDVTKLILSKANSRRRLVFVREAGEC